MTSKEIAHTLLRIYEKRNYSREVIDIFLDTISSHRLLHLLPNILVHITRYEQRNRGRSVCTITIIEPLSKKIHSEIRNRLNVPDSVPLVEVLDTRIIGGFNAKYNYQEFDATMVKTLAQLKNHLQQQV